jgi:hypothetical protein
MRARTPARRYSAAALAWIICAATIAACGSSAKPRGDPGSDPALELAQCMRSHGVPNFPDPGAHGLVIPNNINTQSPAFTSAQRACAKLGSTPTVGGPGQRAASESARLRMVGLANCMRKQGVPDFPDPTTSPPPAPPPGSIHGNVVAIGGVYLQLPPQSPALERAAGACGIPLTAPR